MSESTSLRTSDLEYELPEALIATQPAQPRDSARMLVMYRSSDRIEHRLVRDLPEYLRPGDCMVFNNTAVIPARLIGHRVDTGGKVEGLFLEEIDRESRADSSDRILWRVMLRAGGKLAAGNPIELLDRAEQRSGAMLELVQKDGGEWIVQLHSPQNTIETLNRVGRTPLPPYILHARQQQSASGRADAAKLDEADRAWYQTVYAAAELAKSVAAPTAGLHFTPELLKAIDERGAKRIHITLHVGPGTFKPVTAPTLAEHQMHSEWYEVSQDAVAALREVRHSASASRLIAVGTTSVRTLESVAGQILGRAELDDHLYGPIAGMTDLMIAPPYEFRLVDGMLTNFHLPRSTLLALVAALVGLDRLKAVYREAIERGYRFYSFGDAMLILP